MFPAGTDRFAITATCAEAHIVHRMTQHIMVNMENMMFLDGVASRSNPCSRSKVDGCSGSKDVQPAFRGDCALCCQRPFIAQEDPDILPFECNSVI